MMTRRFVSTVLSLAALLASTAPLSNAALFDLAGATVGGTLQLNGGTYLSGPVTLADGGSGTLDFNLNFDQGPNAPSFVLLLDDDDSPFIFSDRQVVLSITTFSIPFTLESGFVLTVTGLFAAPGSPEVIGDFAFVDGYDAGLLLGSLTTSYTAETGTLIITSTTDIELPDMINLAAQGRLLASPIPEPASFALFAALPIAAIALGRRNRRR